MAQIFPFRAVRYDANRVRLENVLTQPYDKITPEMQERYFASSPYNLITIEKGKTLPGDSPKKNVYTRAAERLDEWLAAGVLRQDSDPCIYAYFQKYALPGNESSFERRGFIALGQLADYSEGVVFPHERTLTAPKADRLELLRHTHCQTGQLFLLYDDRARVTDGILSEAAQERPAAELRDEYGVEHRLWAISDARQIAKITGAMASQKLIIADGHHRYETALAYRNERRKQTGRSDSDAPYEKTMWTCFNIRQAGLTILPTHRLIYGLPQFSREEFLRSASANFRAESLEFASASKTGDFSSRVQQELSRRTNQSCIGFYAGGEKVYFLSLREDARLEELLPDVSVAQRRLGVVLLHRLLLENCLGISPDQVAAGGIGYERSLDAALTAVNAGAAQAAFLLNPVSPPEVVEIALCGEVMPQKSTDFYPKLLSGLCTYRL